MPGEYVNQNKIHHFSLLCATNVNPKEESKKIIPADGGGEKQEHGAGVRRSLVSTAFASQHRIRAARPLQPRFRIVMLASIGHKCRS